MSSPGITVIIPTNRPPRILEPCLRALNAQSVNDVSFEVLVVNDGATHDLTPLADSMRARGLTIRVLDIPRRGPGPARNAGAAAAGGDVLVFTDDDCVPEPGWLAAFAASSQQHPNALLGGKVVNLLPHRLASEASQVLVEFLYAYYNRDPLDARFFTSNNMAARRDVFLGHGGFDETFTLNAGEDRDLCARWREQGGRLVFVPDARIGHAHDLNARRFWEQHYRYGKGAASYWEGRRRSTGARLQVEPAAFYRDLLLYPLRHRTLPGAVASASLIGLAQVANALGFFVAAARWPVFSGAKTGR